MFSLSHWGVVAAVIGFVVLAWKFKRRAPGKGLPAARPVSIQRELTKLAVLIALLTGALSPAFGVDGAEQYIHYIHMLCTVGLAALAYLWMFPKGAK